MAENVQQKDVGAETVQEELARARRQLAVTLDRSVELAQKAIDAELAKRRLVARVSVDSRQPLSAVLEASAALAREELTYEQRRQINAIRQGAEQLLELLVTSIAECIELEIESPLTPSSCEATAVGRQAAETPSTLSSAP